jgi:tRNA/tmRNA/rRNA uracil-C5-methylase (TrmA/RlmC/RlmD family)
VRAGDVITIEAGHLVAGGSALTRVDGAAVFVTGVFPGDVARVRVDEVRKGFAKAHLEELISPGPGRRAAPCPVADQCGGCDWTALRLDHQLQAKRGILVESLRRIGRFDAASLPPIRIHPSPLNYRLRSRLHQDGDRIGFYAARSHEVIPIPQECEVVGIETARHPEPGETWEIEGRLFSGGEELVIEADRYRWHTSAGAFFQVNRHLLGTMIRLVRGHALEVGRRETAVDLYAGVGFFTLPLAGLFSRVVAVEGTPLSVRYAKQNVPGNVRIVEQAVERFASRLPECDFLFLDPPRAGTRMEVIDSAAARVRERISFLSCDPVTFARDASRLAARGWNIRSLDLLDLFPNTPHVETLASFARA